MVTAGRVTIGIPTRNRSDYVARAVRSALAQTQKDIEVVVSDNASTDDTIDQINEMHDSRVKLLTHATNIGMVANFNACLTAASCDLFLMLSDDDILEPGAVELLRRPFVSAPRGLSPDEIGIVWCPCRVINASGEPIWTTGHGPTVERSIETVVGLFDGIRGPRFCSIMVRTADARAVGGYRPEHGPIPDVGNWTKIALRRKFAVCIPEPLARYTVHSLSYTASSVPESWQRAGENIHKELADYLRSTGDLDDLRRLEAARRNFICGLLVTVLMQAMGRPGWVRLAVRELLRAPQYFFTPMVFRRLVKDGHKLLHRSVPPLNGQSGASET